MEKEQAQSEPQETDDKFAYREQFKTVSELMLAIDKRFADNLRKDLNDRGLTEPKSTSSSAQELPTQQNPHPSQ